MRFFSAILLTAFFAISALAQPGSKKGMLFFNGSWSELLDSAKQSGKMIFVDVYTDWCVPCKYMDQHIFTEQRVGVRYNPVFLNYKLNAEKGEGREIARKYGISAYPSFLFLNSGGYLVHKAVGERKADAFIQLAGEAVQQGADSANPGNMEKAFKEGNRDALFLRKYLDRLAGMNVDNSEVLDEYFKTLSDATLEEDSTLLYLGRNIMGAQTVALAYFIRHYDQLSADIRRVLTGHLFDKLVERAAAEALREKRLVEYSGLISFGRRLYGLTPRQQNLLLRLDLSHGILTRAYAQIKEAGYAIAAGPFSIAPDSVRSEDKRRYEAIMRPYLSGEKDSTDIPGFSEEREKYFGNAYSREVSFPLYEAAEAFSFLPRDEKEALQDALAWALRGYALLNDDSVFPRLIRRLEEKLKERH